MNDTVLYSSFEDSVVIALSPNPWDGEWMNRQQVLSRLARKVTVVYSTPALTHWELGSQSWRGARWFGGFDNRDGVWIDRLPRLFVRVPKWRFQSRLVDFLAAARLRRFARRQGKSKVVLIVYRPEFVGYVRTIDPDILVYYAFDAYDTDQYWTQFLSDSQVFLLRAADLVIASSHAIADRLRITSRDGSEISVLENGVDYSAFSSGSLGQCPEDLAKIPHPRIGWTGRLNSKLDFLLLLSLAGANPSWSFVMVGPEVFYDPATARVVEEFKSLPNVYFLGAKHHSELPGYVASMDVNIMSYVVDEDQWSYYGFPLKLHEYLAAGKPVVSADLPSVREYSSVIAIAKSQEEWQQCLLEAIDSGGVGDTDARRNVARLNDWNLRVEYFLAMLSSISESDDTSRDAAE